jgi:hypothetical protein
MTDIAHLIAVVVLASVFSGLAWLAWQTVREWLGLD